MTFTVDPPSTQDVLSALLDNSFTPLPAQEQTLGACTVSWWEMGAGGDVYIHAEHGSPDDRHYASTLVALELAPHGYRRAQFDMDAGHTQRTGSWVQVMADAKRLIQSGNVTIARNGFNYIVGKVIGDHGTYDTEVSRDDPNSRAITGWQCTCPWDQYAWQRTRKWKKFEGRPCKHVMALYWQALGTPLDEQLTQEQAEALGTGQKVPAPAVADHPPEIDERLKQGEEPPDRETAKPDSHAFGLPRSFSPEGDIIQGDQMQLPGVDGIGGPPGPAQAPLAPPPSGPQPAGILPEFHGEPVEQQWGGPGTTPGGLESPPGAYSVPGAKPQSPANPLQNQMTYSRTADFQAPQVVRLKKPGMGLAYGPESGQYGDGDYRDIPAGTLGEVRDQDQRTGWVEVAFPLDDTGAHEPFHVVMYLNPSDIELTDQTNAFIRRV